MRSLCVCVCCQASFYVTNAFDNLCMLGQSTWLKVNRDFGSIFSTLLPGTSAKLQPPEGESVMAGLEVKVAFGSVWKETLTELSGGQRSLLALSLILSLLLFKPGKRVWKPRG